MLVLGIIVLLLIVVLVYSSGRTPAKVAKPTPEAANDVVLHNAGKPKAMSRSSLAALIKSIYNKLTGADAKTIPKHCLDRAHTELDGLVKFAAEDDMEKDMLLLQGKTKIEILRETGDLEKSAECDQTPQNLLQAILFKLRKLEHEVLGGRVEYVNLDFANDILPNGAMPDLITVAVETTIYDDDAFRVNAAVKNTPLGSEIVEPMYNNPTEEKHQYLRGEQYERSGFANDERRVTPIYSVPAKNGYVGTQEKLYNSLLKFQQVREGHPA